jgi:hypothetical protein
MSRRLFPTAVAIAALAACSTPRSPAPAPATVAGPAAPVNAPMACPDDTDTPQILEYTIGTAWRAFRADSSIVPPSCWVAAIGTNQKSFADSTIAMTMAMSDALMRRSTSDVPNLRGRLALLTRVRRYREVPATFEMLVRLDTSAATLANYRLALAAAQRGQDTVARLRYLTAAARKFPSASSIVADYNIQRQVPRLRALIDSTQQILRLDPRRSGGYATLASIYGNLDVPDSAIAYTRRALAAGVPRNDVAPSLQSLIGVVMRKAQLLDAPDAWEATLPVARRIDSALTTDASKHLLALTLSQVAAHRVDSLSEVLGGRGTLNPQAAPAVRPEARTSACRELRDTQGMLEEAAARMAAGGNRFSRESVPAIQNGIAHLRGEIADLLRRCPG